MVRAIAAAFVTLGLVLLAVGILRFTTVTQATEFGEITWTTRVEPEAPRVGEEFTVTLDSCCYGGSPLIGWGLAVIQSDPPVAEVRSLFVYTDAAVTLMALRPGIVEVRVSGAFEKWVCPGTPTPVFPGPGCASTLYYTGASAEVMVSGEEEPTVTPELPEHFGDVNCDGATTSVDAALVLQVTAKLAPFPACIHRADMNTDCYYDARDALLILQTTAGLIPTRTYEPIACPA